MDWDKLKIFHTVAEAGSFTNASTILKPKQNMSKLLQKTYRYESQVGSYFGELSKNRL